MFHSNVKRVVVLSASLVCMKVARMKPSAQNFLRHQKKWWLLPLVFTLLLLGALIVLTQGSALAPFIYALF